jgi:hypothetical protein
VIVRLFHFSDDPNVGVFAPRPVRVTAARPAGREWLNGPLVWAIDERHQAMYLFPRECPRILVWPTSCATPRMIAHIELAWLDRLHTESIHRYELPTTSFEDLDDAGMWVSRTPVVPIGVEMLRDLPAELRAHGVALRVVERLAAVHGVWDGSWHVSAIRLRNATP